MNGKPIISWVIQAAKQSNCFDRIIVSTDDSEIAEISTLHGAEVPFMRPKNLADDHTTLKEVVVHVIKNIHPIPNQVCCILPTAALLTPKDIRKGLETLENSNCDLAFTVQAYSHPIQRALRSNGNGYIEYVNSEFSKTRTQDLEKTWFDAGQSYWAPTKIWLQDGNLLDNKAKAIELPFCIDIDNEADWTICEIIHKNINTP